MSGVPKGEAPIAAVEPKGGKEAEEAEVAGGAGPVDRGGRRPGSSWGSSRRTGSLRRASCAVWRRPRAAFADRGGVDQEAGWELDVEVAEVAVGGAREGVEVDGCLKA